MDDLSRRHFMGLVPAAALIPAVASPGRQESVPQPHDAFPRHHPEMAREIVGAAHGNVSRVRELVSARPALAGAAWEWGYGDWETALGAASHTGQKEIAAVLLAAGAHPTIFSAAMLGHLEAVKALVAASPGIQRTRGPHGISLLNHARAGQSTEVVRYLEALGDADPAYPDHPMSDQDVAGLLGTYRFGAGATESIVVTRHIRGMLMMKREGEPDRRLFHHGQRVFNPPGAEAVRICFEPANGRATTLTVRDGREALRASR